MRLKEPITIMSVPPSDNSKLLGVVCVYRCVSPVIGGPDLFVAQVHARFPSTNDDVLSALALVIARAEGATSGSVDDAILAAAPTKGSMPS